MTDIAYNKLLKRVVSDPKICGGDPCIRGTRIHVAVILDSLAEGLLPGDIVQHFPPLTVQDVRAAVAPAVERN
ncbi:MAG TPA: hypothetical protein DC047_06380 [Blastocatellia bacterium]|nr:hypothetical protein [Blastocatellia bacterium]